MVGVLSAGGQPTTISIKPTQQAPETHKSVVQNANPPNRPKSKPIIHPEILNIAGKKYIRTHWGSALASDYSYGIETAWNNGKWSTERWDFDHNRWIRKPSIKLYHFEWQGHRDWHRFGTYKNDIPTVAHKHHELGTFVIFKYHGREVVALITDRGPHIANREWDLNPALKRKLHFNGLDNVEYNVLRRVP